uniref:Uncharacterized protein n=1 Tax=Brassica oleracea TaxID=3712 RepID=A0A3P6C5J3_BRAOL|nr:unnamed protein product [Brassica oleracea]
MVRRKFVGKFRRNSDDFTVNRNVVGNSSEYTDELPTTTTVTFFIGMSSKSRRKIPTTLVSSEISRVESSTFEIINVIGINVIGDEERIIGLWTPSSGLVNAKSNKTTSFLGKRFGPVIWPGNSTVVPKGWEIPTSGKKIKVGVPVNKGFLNFVEIKTNPISNLTTVRGYAIDIFEAALKELPYSVIPQYGFEPPGDNYNDLVYQVFDGPYVITRMILRITREIGWSI